MQLLQLLQVPVYVPVMIILLPVILAYKAKLLSSHKMRVSLTYFSLWGVRQKSLEKMGQNQHISVKTRSKTGQN